MNNRSIILKTSYKHHKDIIEVINICVSLEVLCGTLRFGLHRDPVRTIMIKLVRLYLSCLKGATQWRPKVLSM